MAEKSVRSFSVFLCHASEDKPEVRELYRKLTDDGIEVWLDELKLLPGQDWVLEITEALRAADAILICLSTKSVTKEGFVQKEIRRAMDIADEKPEGTIFLIPVRLDDCVLPRRLAAIQYVDLYALNSYQKLLQSLRIRAESLGLPLTPRRAAPPSEPDYLLARMLKDMLRDDDGLKETLSYLVDREPDTNGWFHTELRRKLQEIICSQGYAVRERARAGDVLARIGDPRFRADVWYLPDEALLGFVEIPAGAFLMGNDDAINSLEGRRASPQHPVKLPTFYINRYSVTVAQYRAFMMDTIPQSAHDLYGIGADNHPMTSVTWQGAIDYCSWLNDQLRKWPGAPGEIAHRLGTKEESWMVTLPSEAEWEKAARGSEDNCEYPWGAQADPNLANYADTNLKNTSPAGCFERANNPYGLQDMNGNIWEWTRSNWGFEAGVPGFKYPYISDDGREDFQTSDAMLKVIRGGSFYSTPEEIRCSHRGAAFPDKRYNHIGFRLVITRLTQR